MGIAFFEKGHHEPWDIALGQVASAWAKAWDFDFFAYLAFRGHESGRLYKYVSNYPKEWSARYEREGLQKSDPIVAIGRVKRKTFAWRAADMNICRSLEERQVMKSASAMQIRCGITTPAHGPRGEFSLLTLASKDGNRSLAETVIEIGPALLWLTVYAHAQVQNQIASEPETPNLTGRERECLFWTSQGKTSWEISKIIGRSEATVNYHLKNCICKLEASNKCHAVTKALAHGFLPP